MDSRWPCLHTVAHAETKLVHSVCVLTLLRGVDSVILCMSLADAHHDSTWHGRDDDNNDGCLLIYLPQLPCSVLFIGRRRRWRSSSSLSSSLLSLLSLPRQILIWFLLLFVFNSVRWQTRASYRKNDDRERHISPSPTGNRILRIIIK